MLYSFQIYSRVIQLCIYMLSVLFQILFPFRLLQNIKQSSPVLGPCYFFFSLKYSFIFGCSGSLLLQEGFLQLQRAGAIVWLCYTGFSLQWLLLFQTMDSRTHRLKLQSTGLIIVAHGFSCSEASSGTRDQTGVPCIARWTFNHWTTRKPSYSFYIHQCVHVSPQIPIYPSSPSLLPW